MFNTVKQFAHQLISPQGASRAKYEIFKNLLKHDRRCHELLAELEELYYHHEKVDINVISRLFSDLSSSVSAMVASLTQLAPGSYVNLRDYYKKFDFYARFALSPPEIDISPPFTLSLDGFYHNDLQVGGKGFHLCQLKRQLGLPVPHGFIISTSAYNALIESNKLRPRIYDTLATLDATSSSSLKQASDKLRQYVLSAHIPADLKIDIFSSFKNLQAVASCPYFALRSSAVSEDSHISFAGQYESVLQVTEDKLLEAYKQVLAGKFSHQALSYRINNGLIDDATPMAVLVLEMVDAHKSGVMTSRDPMHSDDDAILIHSVKGLGEALVGGRTSPHTTIIRKGSLGVTEEHHSSFEEQNDDDAHNNQPSPLSSEQNMLLAAWARQIETFYQAPQEIEWCVSREGQLFILQTRALLVQKKQIHLERPPADQFQVLLQGGETASRGAACGPVYHIRNQDQLETVPSGAILVTSVTPPSSVSVLRTISGVVAEMGSVADHFSSVAREYGVPVLVKTGMACRKLPQEKIVTLWADEKMIYDGHVDSLLETRALHLEDQDQSPFTRALNMVVQFVSPLKLVNPADPLFVPESCRSFHDIIRFAHEKAVLAMFSQTKGGLIRKGGAKPLTSKVPLSLFVIDVGGGIAPQAKEKSNLQITDIHSKPLLAVWKGITNQRVDWSRHDHFDWKTFDEINLAGGIASKKDSSFASYAIISNDYLNLNIRFGYHFAILDSLCGKIPEGNYILLRFAGGGGDFTGRSLRLRFIQSILQKLDFITYQKGDLLDARLMRYDKKVTAEKLDMLGRLLGATRLMDMVLKDERMVERLVEEFMQGRYDFSG
ncbi:MAG: hypothetical protein KQH63_02335 [Desulfobulbaceae bacterium]|nr:hypothetical protein [Desulfobulbaceae bacterium]